MHRAVVVGTTGSGKSTLAQALAARLRVPFIELDGLYWGANWTPVGKETFRERVKTALAGEEWSAGGNYSVARDLIWGRADTLIWLDYPLTLCLWRLFWRTIRRAATHEDLWGTGNHETWRKAFFSRDSLFLWALKSYPRHRREYPRQLQKPEHAHLTVLHFRTPSQTADWLRQVG
jgi:adenylate kinase family enzyme